MNQEAIFEVSIHKIIDSAEVIKPTLNRLIFFKQKEILHLEHTQIKKKPLMYNFRLIVYAEQTF